MRSILESNAVEPLIIMFVEDTSEMQNFDCDCCEKNKETILCPSIGSFRSVVPICACRRSDRLSDVHDLPECTICGKDPTFKSVRMKRLPKKLTAEPVNNQAADHPITQDIFSNSCVVLALTGYNTNSGDRLIFSDAVQSISMRINRDRGVDSPVVSALGYGANETSQFSLVVAKYPKICDFFYLLAIIRGIPIVSYDWLIECSSSGSWISPTLFRIPNSFESKRSEYLFAGLTFYVGTNSYFSKKEVETLILECGGCVVSVDACNYLITDEADFETRATSHRHGSRIVSSSGLVNSILKWTPEL